MLEEIRQQPDALARTLAARAAAASRSSRLVEKRRPRLIVLVARGTSDNAALFGRYLLEIATGIPVSLAAPSIATLYERASTIATRWWWRSRNRANPPTRTWCWSAREAGRAHAGHHQRDAPAPWRASPSTSSWCAPARERSVAATKTYTGQMLMLYLLAYALGGGVRIADLERLPGAVDAALRLEPEIDALSERYRFMRHAVVVGRGLNYANAFEFALKLMETCYVVAERFSSADFLHGPIALVEPSFPVFAFAPPGVTWPSIGETLWKSCKACRRRSWPSPIRATARSMRAPPASFACRAA